MRIGIDIGGSNIRGVLLGDQMLGVASRRDRTPKSYSGLLEVVERIIYDLEEQAHDVCSVGIGCPGALSLSTGLMKNANCTWLIGNPFMADITERLKRPVRIDNDANCFTLSEVLDGAGSETGVTIGVVLGSGVGSGIAVNGRILKGASAIAGEWGHCPLPWASNYERNRPCYCGKSGCIETLLSGKGFAEDHLQRTGKLKEASVIVARAKAGDVDSQRTVTTYCDRLARSLSMMVNIVDPEIVVLGGGMANIEEIYKEVPGLLSRWVFSDDVVVRILKTFHGDMSGARGAALLW